ncbi:MAG: nucleotidyltransferase family protein [Planctomycetota bacterium]
MTIFKDYRERLEDVCRQFHVRRLEVFGSAAQQDLEECRDVDLLVEFDESASPRLFDIYFGLHQSLENLFAKPVDLVEPEGLRNPFFIKQVNVSRRTLYVAP